MKKTSKKVAYSDNRAPSCIEIGQLILNNTSSFLFVPTKTNTCFLRFFLQHGAKTERQLKKQETKGKVASGIKNRKLCSRLSSVS